MLVTAGTNPHRLRNEASLAALCGAAPVPASSGKITRHRLSRGGDRAANNALYRIALVRHGALTPNESRVRVGHMRTKKEILRLLKRAIVREIFRLLTRPGPIDDYRDLRPARQAKKITLAPARIRKPANKRKTTSRDLDRTDLGNVGRGVIGKSRPDGFVYQPV